MSSHRRKIGQQSSVWQDFGEYLSFIVAYIKSRIYIPFSKFEMVKDFLVSPFYKKRGRYSRPLSHLATIGLIFAVVLIAPIVLDSNGQDAAGEATMILSASADEPSFYTSRAEEVELYRGGEVVVHTVGEGETLQSIAERYGLQPETIVWENNLSSTKATLEVGTELNILPIDGLRHKVAKGETIYTIAEKYGLSDAQAQMIVDYPFNEFANDETFELAVGQYIMVPDGVKQSASSSGATYRPTYAIALTANAGDVSGSGAFMWPASGGISQGYKAGIHMAIDIANRSAGPILAADAGTVIAAGWDNSGYGNRVIIDHGNGFITLYAHMSSLSVQAGQGVNQGSVVGQMGSTGRSTGTHLHFEIRSGGAFLNPLQYLK